jgi:hypothetical protein
MEIFIKILVNITYVVNLFYKNFAQFVVNSYTNIIFIGYYFYFFLYFLYF